MEAFIQVMESTIAVKDPYTVVHQRQVTRIAYAIGQELGLAEDRLRDLYIAGALPTFDRGRGRVVQKKPVYGDWPSASPKKHTGP